ncbi:MULTISPECIES: twin-arginine translocase TatA [Anaplasmataceae]|uniref:Sec-independent protein translocase protein TatA n=3 Tax=Anaplasmataceae TaxID=942 RepID=C6V4X1_NEORI|nr:MULTISPECIES: twin-arginine translocase TatA/TatE family subunit [Neorickettsia]ABD45947.1 twin-arginine translocation protein, TatA/E family [Neorickettsia sennetsu str. Miyayama]ACT69424.1 Twin-arginine translocation protein, TatA/E family [Neorickettsia risticii str. Illinois]QHD65209.1 twin-arginine translocase TatA/TatE family subunit [Neorickettsia findlayensis]
MSLGPWQILLVFLIILVLFGAGKLPQVISDIGRGLRTLREELKDSEKKAER